MKSFSFVMLLLLIAMSITGCGEETEDPITATKTEDALFGSLSEMKKPELPVAPAAPGAPTAPTDGTPFVKSVKYYKDWKLTEELDSEKPVPVGTTIFIHIVFSEPMKHRLTDNPKKKGALPILQYWGNSEVTRFRMMAHGASGEDFVSGDAKPKGGGTDDFVCRYKVEAEDKGSQFWVRVGEWSMDLEWNKLKESYTHQTKLKLGEVPEATQEEQVAVGGEEPEPTTTEPADNTPPTVVSITHYRDSDGTVIPAGGSVKHNTTVKTEIMFSEPINPESIIVTYTTGNKTGRYAYSAGGIHWRGTFQVGKDNKSILCKQYAQEDAFVVTLKEAEDLTGNALAGPIITPKLTVTSHAVTVPEPQGPTVLSVSHYFDDGTLVGEGGPVGILLLTLIQFSGPVEETSLDISYTTGGETQQYKVISKDQPQEENTCWLEKEDTVICKARAGAESFAVTVTINGGKPFRSKPLRIVTPLPPPEPPTRVTPIDTTPAPQEPTQVVTISPDEMELYRLADTKIWNALYAGQRALDSGDFSPLSRFFAKELGVPFTSETNVAISQTYRKIFPDRWKKVSSHSKLLEYFKLQLQNLDKGEEEILVLYEESIRKGIVDYIDTNLLNDTKTRMK